MEPPHVNKKKRLWGIREEVLEKLAPSRALKQVTWVMFDEDRNATLGAHW